MRNGRLWITLLAAFALSFTLAACNGGNEETTAEPAQQASTAPDFTANFVGVWQLDSAIFDGEEATPDEMAAMRELGFGSYIVLNEDGTGRLISFDESDPTYEEDDIAFEWKATGSMAATILENDEVQEMELTLSGGRIVLEADEDNVMRYAKSSQEEMDQTRANGVAAAASASTPSSGDFTGDLVDYYYDGTYGFGFYAPANPSYSDQEDEEIYLHYNDPELWVGSWVYGDEADSFTTEENANYYVENDGATIEFIEDGLVCLSGLDDDGDQYYTLIATKDNDNIYLKVIYHTADDELMYPIAQAILGSLEF